MRGRHFWQFLDRGQVATILALRASTTGDLGAEQGQGQKNRAEAILAGRIARLDALGRLKKGRSRPSIGECHAKNTGHLCGSHWPTNLNVVGLGR
jgi:hypothetical protein